MTSRFRTGCQRLLQRYAAAGYPLLPVTRLLQRPLRWFYHQSSVLRHDSKFHWKPFLLKNAHEYLVRELPSDFRIYRNQIRFRSTGSLMSAHGYYVGEIEYHLLQYVVGCLRPGFTLVDVGAHHGAFSLVVAHELRSRGWEGQVHSFEPHPENLELLEHNIAANALGGYIRVYRTAVSDTEGHQVLLINRTENSDNALGTNAAFKDQRRPQDLREHPVEVTRLDRGLEHVGSVDLIKIDVQGSEPSVLRGATEVLRRFRPRIVLEATPGHASADESRQLLEAHGYVIRGVDRHGHLCDLASPAVFVQWDWVAVPS